MTNQSRINAWVRKVFTAGEAFDVPERALRCAEETIELAQACGVSREQIHKLVDYVFSRPVGIPAKEIAGVLVTAYAVAGAIDADADEELEAELARIHLPHVIERIRRRQTEKREAVSTCESRSPNSDIRCALPDAHAGAHVAGNKRWFS